MDAYKRLIGGLNRCLNILLKQCWDPQKLLILKDDLFYPYLCRLYRSTKGVDYLMGLSLCPNGAQACSRSLDTFGMGQMGYPLQLWRVWHYCTACKTYIVDMLAISYIRIVITPSAIRWDIRWAITY